MPHLTIHNIDYHRNGVGGTGFYAVLFREFRSRTLLWGIVFPEPGSVAIISPKEGIRERFRGDYYEDALRAAIKEHEERV